MEEHAPNVDLDPEPSPPGTPRMADPTLLARRTQGWTVEQWAKVEPRRAYVATRAIVQRWLRSCWRMRWYGAELVPTSGSTLSCPNHSSWLDSWIQAIGHRRMPRWMGKQELLAVPIIGGYLRRGGVFPVARGRGDAAAIDIASVLLDTGQHVVVYPEGTRIRSATGPGGLGASRSGAARLALATGAPIQPVATYGLKHDTGREHLPRALRYMPFARRVTTVYGEPFSVAVVEHPTAEQIDELRDEIWNRVRDLYALARDASIEQRRPDQLQLPGGRIVQCGTV